MRWTSLALVLALSACSATEPSDPAVADPVPFRTLSQDQHGAEEPSLVVVRSSEEAAAFFADRGSGARFPEAVAYGAEMVVGVQLGTRSHTGYSVDVYAIELEGDGIIVFAQETDRGGGRTALTYPSHFIVMRHVDGPVALAPIEVVQTYESDAP